MQVLSGAALERTFAGLRKGGTYPQVAQPLSDDSVPALFRAFPKLMAMSGAEASVNAGSPVIGLGLVNAMEMMVTHDPFVCDTDGDCPWCPGGLYEECGLTVLSGNVLGNVDRLVLTGAVLLQSHPIGEGPAERYVLRIAVDPRTGLAQASLGVLSVNLNRVWRSIQTDSPLPFHFAPVSGYDKFSAEQAARDLDGLWQHIGVPA